MSAAMLSASTVLSPAGYARRVRAAQRRAADARRLAESRPTPANQERAQELEAGLHRLETQAPA